MATLIDIEGLTKEFSTAREVLADRVKNLEDEMAALKRRYLHGIKKAVQWAMEQQVRLHAAIEESPELFQKPRTIIIHGIKVGYQKAKGEITWEDSDQVVRLIHKYYPSLADVLIKTTETPLKKALANMSGLELKKLGVTVIETGDEIVIKSTDSEIDKLVSALLKEDEILRQAQDDKAAA